MLIDVNLNYYGTCRVAYVDSRTLRVEVDRLRSDPSIVCYSLVGTTDQGRLLIRCSDNVHEMMDLYDFYMDLVDKQVKAVFDRQPGGDPV